MDRLKSSMSNFYGLYGDFMEQYEGLLSRMLSYILDRDNTQLHHQSTGNNINS